MSKFINYLNGNALSTSNCFASEDLDEDFKVAKSIEKYKKILQKFDDILGEAYNVVRASTCPDIPKDAVKIVGKLDKVTDQLLYALDRIQQFEIPEFQVVQPKTRDELKKVITDTIMRKGETCDLNFIDVSKITNMSGYSVFQSLMATLASGMFHM